MCQPSGPCNEALCEGGACLQIPIDNCCESAADCVDELPCTDDLCGDDNTCEHIPLPDCCNDDAQCADGNLCTLDTCELDNGECSNALVLCADEDSDPCTIESCDGDTGECISTPIVCSAPGESCVNGLCESTDECASETDLCHEDATCFDTQDGYLCFCSPGTSGDGYSCEAGASTTLIPGSKTENHR